MAFEFCMVSMRASVIQQESKTVASVASLPKTEFFISRYSVFVKNVVLLSMLTPGKAATICRPLWFKSSSTAKTPTFETSV